MWRTKISPQPCLSLVPAMLSPSAALRGMTRTWRMKLERLGGWIAKDFSCCVIEFGLFPVGSGKPPRVFKWILIPLPMGDGMCEIPYARLCPEP